MFWVSGLIKTNRIIGFKLLYQISQIKLYYLNLVFLKSFTTDLIKKTLTLVVKSNIRRMTEWQLFSFFFICNFHSEIMYRF